MTLPDTLRAVVAGHCPAALPELADLLAEYPPQAFNLAAARTLHARSGLPGTHLVGLAEAGQVYLLDDESLQGGHLLAIYCHEIAHACLQRAGHPDADRHTPQFWEICRGLQLRFAVADFSDDDYDLRDTTRAGAEALPFTARRAASIGRAYEFDADQWARQAAATHWRQFLIFGAVLVVLVVAAAAVLILVSGGFSLKDWIEVRFDRGTMILASGGSVVLYLLLLMWRRD